MGCGDVESCCGQSEEGIGGGEEWRGHGDVYMFFEAEDGRRGARESGGVGEFYNRHVCECVCVCVCVFSLIYM